MKSPSRIFKIASIVQITATVLGLILMLVAFFSEKSNHPEWMLFSGGAVVFLFFVIAVSSAVKTFSQNS